MSSKTFSCRSCPKSFPKLSILKQHRAKCKGRLVEQQLIRDNLANTQRRVRDGILPNPLSSGGEDRSVEAKMGDDSCMMETGTSDMPIVEGGVSSQTMLLGISLKKTDIRDYSVFWPTFTTSKTYKTSRLHCDCAYAIRASTYISPAPNRFCLRLAHTRSPHSIGKNGDSTCYRLSSWPDSINV